MATQQMAPAAHAASGSTPSTQVVSNLLSPISHGHPPAVLNPTGQTTAITGLDRFDPSSFAENPLTILNSKEMAESKPELRKPVFFKVEQLRQGTSGHTLTVKVVSSKMVMQRGRSDGPQSRQMRIVESLVGDATGIIVFTARNEQDCQRAYQDPSPPRTGPDQTGISRSFSTKDQTDQTGISRSFSRRAYQDPSPDGHIKILLHQ